MKFGFRTPCISKSIKSRTTGRARRTVKSLTDPYYGKRGTGWAKSPKTAAYNKIYHTTTTSIFEEKSSSEKNDSQELQDAKRFQMLGDATPVSDCLLNIDELIHSQYAFDDPNMFFMHWYPEYLETISRLSFLVNESPSDSSIYGNQQLIDNILSKENAQSWIGHMVVYQIKSIQDDLSQNERAKQEMIKFVQERSSQVKRYSFLIPAEFMTEFNKFVSSAINQIDKKL
ncbi:hypothetical protein [Levilactobacillus brevis]|uniref:hypothetical protein n=1 Tax=Levilactobacillus brevis TaxID=1580 RepID=UPI001CDC5090